MIPSTSPSSSTTPQTSQPQATPPSTTPRQTPAVVSTLSTAMENIYTPLVLPTNPGAMPQDYQSKITPLDGSSTYNAQQHTKNMTDYFEIYEIDTNDV